MSGKGSAQVIAISFIALALLGIGIWTGYKGHIIIDKNKIDYPPSIDYKNPQTTIRLSPIVNGNPPCNKSGRVTFATPFMNPNDLKAIWPLGRTANDHVTPTDHQYYITTDAARKNGTVLYAPADGIIFGIIKDDISEKIPNLPESERFTYGIAISYSCTQALTFAGIAELVPELKKFASPNNAGAKDINIPVKAGQMIGTIHKGMESWLIDATSKLTGFIDDGDYLDENWKPYSHSLFDYFVPALRDQYNAKSLRKVEPFGGKIDYDLQGKLIGNWFKQGVLPYYMRQTNFWQNELAIFYDYIEPDQIRVMIGQFADSHPGNFGFDVVGNAPDPATISVASGLIKYSLVDYLYADESGLTIDEIGINIDEMSGDKVWHVQNEKSVWGVALVQMIEDRKIKFEVFPGKTVDQVDGFTENAQIYER